MILLPNVIKQAYYAEAMAIDLTPVIVKAPPGPVQIVEKHGLAAVDGDLPARADAQAEKILADARKEAEAVLERARLLSEKEFDLQQKAGYDYGFDTGVGEGHTQGYAKGYEEGLVAGRSEARTAFEEETASVSKTLEKMIGDFECRKNDLITQSLEDLQFLAVAIARKILKTELLQNPDVIRKMVLSALEAYKNQKWIRIQVWPKAAEALEGYLPELNRLSEDVKILSSDDMEPGGCVIETPVGMMDAGITTQLDFVKAVFQQALQEQGA